MVGNTPDLTVKSELESTDLNSTKTVKGQVMYVPLQFWFCKNPGLALPLIALNNVGQKSIQPRTFGLCARENLLKSQGFFGNQTQMLVA
jgi:hypothetical protein